MQTINWQEVITTLGGNAAFLAVGGWLIKTVISHGLTREAEAFKIQLRADADREIAALKIGLQARNPSINPCFWMERSVGTLNWFTTMLGWQVNQTGRVAIKNIEVERKKSKRRQESHFARRLVSRGLGFLDRWCS